MAYPHVQHKNLMPFGRQVVLACQLLNEDHFLQILKLFFQ
jgi:hypothetical protein